MDESFFQTLRKIQKKERSNASLARVGSDFYKQIHSYINKLKRSVGNDPFADEHYLLKDSQRIATEICERREHKITDAAVMNIHRSYHLFSKTNPEFDLLDTTPLNLTKEEETLYFSLIDTLKEHRSKISLDKFASKEEAELNRQPVANPYEDETEIVDYSSNHFDDKIDLEIPISEESEKPHKEEAIKKKTKRHSDAILSKLDKIKRAKIVEDEKYEDINKQIANKNKFNNQNSVNNQSSMSNNDFIGSNRSVDATSKEESSSIKSSPKESNSFPNVGQLYEEDNQFINLDDFEDEYYDNILNEPNPFEFDDLIKQSKNKSKESKNKLESNKPNSGVSKDSKPVSTSNNLEHSNLANDYESNEVKDEVKVKNQDNIAILMFNDVGPIIGVDEKSYGPFRSQDIVILPKINAEIFLNANKARLINI